MPDRIRLTIDPDSQATLSTLANATGYPESFVAGLACKKGLEILLSEVSAVLAPLGGLQAPADRVREALCKIVYAAPIANGT